VENSPGRRGETTSIDTANNSLLQIAVMGERIKVPATMNG